MDKYTPPNKTVLKLFSKMGGGHFDQMRTYLFEMDTSMRNQRASLNESLKEELVLFPNAKDLTEHVYQRHFENYDSHFVWLLLNSALVTSYSVFEDLFQKVCFYSSELRGIKLKKDHFGAGNIVERCKKFIETEIRLDLSEVEDEWAKLVLCQGIRNKIVHHSGRIPAGNISLTEHAKTNPHLTTEKTKGSRDVTIFITHRIYIYDYITIASSYLLWILIRVRFKKTVRLPVNVTSK
ncbi:MAG: hypothetical protein U0V64_16100 [Cyclobacteriaceae bacterium]